MNNALATERVRKFRDFTQSAHGAAGFSKEQFEKCWSEVYGADAQAPSFTTFQGFMKLGNRLSDSEFADLLGTGDVPPLKLSAEEMQIASGGRGPLSDMLYAVEGFLKGLR